MAWDRMLGGQGIPTLEENRSISVMGSITMGSTFHFEGLNNLKFQTRKGVTQPKFWWWHTKKGI